MPGVSAIQISRETNFDEMFPDFSRVGQAPTQ